MKYLFIIRHGHCDYRQDLSSLGEEQIESITKNMRSIVGEVSNGHYLLSSSAPRAEQSAHIIAKAFGLEKFDRDELLWTEGGHISPERIEAIDRMIAPHRDNHDIVTIVGHYEVVDSYPSYVVRNLFGRDVYIKTPGEGQGVYLDVENQTHQMLLEY